MDSLNQEYHFKNDVSNSGSFKKRLYAINLPKFEEQISKSYLKTHELKCATIDNGIILPLRKTEIPATDGVYEGGVCNEKFEFIAGYKRKDNEKLNNFECIRSYKVNDDTIHEVDEEVIFAGIAYSHFGHFIVETMNRLWWVVKNNIYDKKVVFLKNKDFDSAFIQLIEMVGIKKEHIVFLDEPTKFKKVHIPDQSLMYFDYYHEEFVLPYQAIMENILPSKDKRIYLSRTQFVKKDCINEEYFEDFYQKLGFRIVYPEQLDIKEQISIVAGADEIVSTIGSVSHLALFAKKGTKIVTLLRARNYFNVTQEIINQAKGLDSTFIDVTCNFLPYRYSANCYYIGPNISWATFVKQEYDIEIDSNLTDYLNSGNNHIGDYFKQWIKIFSSENQLKKIKNDNSLDILKNLEIVFSNELNNFQTVSQKISKQLVKKQNNLSTFSDKVFVFSRYDGTYSRLIRLNSSGSIETLKGKHHKNESYWNISDDNLVFFNNEGKITSKYFCIKNKTDGFFILGYYEPNREIIFRLQEVQ